MAGNESAAAGPVTGTARDVQAPSIPQNLSASNVTSNSVTLTWSPSTETGGSGLAGYRVFRNDNLIATVNGTTFINSGLAAGTQYRYRVAAVDNAGNQSGLSSQVTVNTKKR